MRWMMLFVHKKLISIKNTERQMLQMYKNKNENGEKRK